MLCLEAFAPSILGSVLYFTPSSLFHAQFCSDSPLVSFGIRFKSRIFIFSTLFVILIQDVLLFDVLGGTVIANYQKLPSHQPKKKYRWRLVILYFYYFVQFNNLHLLFSEFYSAYNSLFQLLAFNPGWISLATVFKATKVMQLSFFLIFSCSPIIIVTVSGRLSTAGLLTSTESSLNKCSQIKRCQNK